MATMKILIFIITLNTRFNTKFFLEFLIKYNYFINKKHVVIVYLMKDILWQKFQPVS